MYTEHTEAQSSLSDGNLGQTHLRFLGFGIVKAKKNSCIAIVALWAVFFSIACNRSATLMPPPPVPEVVDPWKEAALKVEEDRGQPMGRAARVEIPDQVKHYSDNRRFLAIQIAEARQHQLRSPHDFAELIQLIRNRELVEVPALGDGYILYGVGLSATEDKFTHYEATSGNTVPLFQNDDQLKAETDQLDQSIKELTTLSEGLRNDLKQTARRDRERRKALQDELNANERALGKSKREKQLLNRFYSVPSSRKFLEAEFQVIASQSGQFATPYNLDDPSSRKALKARLLSFLRPAALKVLEQLAQSYRNRFSRPLAISSLVRTEEYQRQLRGSNPNATLVQTPPHTTGLAFDVLYKYMAADEQMFLMTELARLRDEGRIEVLRENRDHFHVFAFIDGQRPTERLIEASLGIVGPTPAEKPEQGENKRTARGPRKRRLP